MRTRYQPTNLPAGTRLEGWWTVDEPTRRRFAGFETASMWEEYEIAPGSYPVISYRDAGSCTILHVHGQATVTDDFFQNRLLGHFTNHRGEHIGQQTQVRVSFYRYEADKIAGFEPLEDAGEGH